MILDLSGLLPIGTFTVCYEFLITKYNKIVQECQQINIPPLGPLLLTQPTNGSVLEELHPTLGWLPPSPVNSLNNLRYELVIVEVLPSQSDADAIQNNVPLLPIPNLVTTSFSFLQSTSAITLDKKYAWQVIAINNLTVITKSDIWSFSTKKEATAILPTADPVYIKLKKEDDNIGYTIFWENIRFDYMNETNDNVWDISIEDLTASQHKSFSITPDSTKLKRGRNLVSYEAFKDKRFIEKHQYLLKITNSRNEVWQLRFEYRKPD